ncbi:MAG: hydrogenase iron-sulfur subunit [Thermoplasmata archaeon]|nr:MAG: hydrogenase iron-sulfur subunit [Thermoplasmata archaeon]
MATGTGSTDKPPVEKEQVQETVQQPEPGKFEPQIIGFLCNWCSYAGADLAGVSRIQYPSNLKVIRVMCSGSVDPILIVESLIRGADGVLVAGCHPGDCHYIKGNYYTKNRIKILKEIIKKTGIETERIKLEWVSASEGSKFASVVKEFTDKIRELGPSMVAGDQPNIDQLEGLYVLRNILEDFRLNVFITRMHEWIEDGNVYGDKLSEEQIMDHVNKVVDDEFLRTRILFATKEKALSVQTLSNIFKEPQQKVLEHLVTLRDRDLVRVEGTEEDAPLYIAQPQEGKRISTLPRWAQVERKSITISLANLGDVDPETRSYIARELLLTLRCYNCERRRSEVCHFSVCIRGLMSGVVE